MSSISKKIYQITCPISAEKVDEDVVRLVATQVVILGLVFIIDPNIWIPLFLIFDFYLRAFTTLNISVLGNIAKAMKLQFLSSRSNLIDRAPKRFAAALGFVFSIFIASTFFFGLVLSSKVITITLLVCAMLEAFLGVCVGCYVYHFIYKKD